MYNQPSEPHNQYDQPQYERGYQPQPYQSPPTYGQPGQEPMPEGQYQQQQYEQPSYGQPTYGQPTYGQPVYGQPVYGQPIYVQPVYVQPTPIYGQPQVNIQIGGVMPQMVMEPPKSWLATLLLCIFLGPLGIHRFYSGHIAIGLFQFFTWGGFGIWWLIDLILILTGSYTDRYGRPLQK